jgi:hypothetical protein
MALLMSSIVEIQRLLKEILSMMVADGEKNWIKGIKAALDTCNAYLNNNLKEIEALDEIRSLIKGMYGGAGSFSDYILWHDDPAERQRLNERFDLLTNELWRELGLN